MAIEKTDPTHKPRVVTDNGAFVNNTKSGGIYLDEDEAKKDAEKRNKAAKDLGIQTRYKVEE